MGKKIKEAGVAGKKCRELQRPKLVCLEIDQISLYDRNPRTVRNPEYERIKHSIANHGLEQPLIVTRRPDENSYFVKAGGNTRLQILKELHQATGDPCYAMVNCIEVGWQDESTVLLGHLRENSLRGNLVFIDQAAAVCAYGELLAEELGTPTLTLAELEIALKENGLPLSHGSLSRMRYAAKILMPVMPVALCSGLGHRLVADISKLHRQGSQFWVRRGIGSVEEFDATFSELCRRYDGPDWQLELLQRAVEVEIAEAADISVQTVRMSVDAAKLAALPPPQFPTSNTVEAEPTHSAAIATEPNSSTSKKNGTSADDDGGLTLTVSVDLNDAEGGLRPAIDVEQPDPFLELRQRAYGLARSLATSFRLGELVVPLRDCGNGFLLADFPNGELLDSSETDFRAMIGTVWWQLLAFSETGNAPMGVIEDRLPHESALRDVLLNDKLELLFERVDIINAPQFADRFWARLPKKEWQDWLYLAHTHREIRGKVIETEQPLWLQRS